MRVFLFSGHMIDAPGRQQPRFPTTMESAVRDAIAIELNRHGACHQDIGVGGAACGSDILFSEGLLQRGAALRLYLAFPEHIFLRESVAFAGHDWVQRFHAVTSRAQVDVLPVHTPLAITSSDAYERANLWMIEEARRLGGDDIVFLCVWNGEGGDGRGGTGHMVQEVEAAGGSVARIDPKSL